MTPVIQLHDVERTYPGTPPVHALEPVTLDIERGSWWAIIGRSGSGKSTLLHLLGLLDRPTSGRYLLNEIDTSVASERTRAALRAELIGFVFQDFHLLGHRNAVHNVALGQLYRGTRRSRRQSDALEALDRVGLAHLSHVLPGTMSGGERQRVAIARALAGSTHVILCDEPTGNLDSTNTAAIVDLLEQLHDAGQTIVIVTHDDTIAARTQRCARMIDGHLEVIR